ncbi:hypothetical protein RJ55_07080 [Drechmeria coniospora]|nr:hypothetical protein RJ55_07080 [Drechmeria coniospora]
MLPQLLVTVLTGLFWLTNRVYVGLGLCLAVLVLYRLTLHPLAGVPGPRLAAVSNLWHAYQVRNGRMSVLARTLHKRYGHVVRVGPNEVWFDSKEAFDQIYSMQPCLSSIDMVDRRILIADAGTGKGFEKSDFYLSTCLNRPRLDWMLRPHFQDTLDLLSERDMKRYRLQRRLIGRTYHASNVIKYESAIDNVLHRATEKLASLQGAEVDLKEWMHIITVECLGACVLSWSPGMLKNGTDRGTITHSYQGWRRKSFFGLFPTMTKLELCSSSIGRAFGTLCGVTYKTPENFRPFFPDVAKRLSRRLKSALRLHRPKGDDDLLADLIQLHKEKPEFNETYLRKMAITNFGAGHETMASTLTSILAMVGSDEQVQKVVTAEIRQHSRAAAAYADVARLRQTRAAIKESMRLHPVIGMSLPRTTPSSGLQLHARWFPPKTTVGCNPLALHLNEDIFGPDADRFDPSRWLGTEATGSRARTMDRYNLGWGGGSRTCPGRNLAELVVFKVVTALLLQFDVTAEMPAEDAQRTFFLSMLTGVKARFRRAKVDED